MAVSWTVDESTETVVIHGSDDLKDWIYNFLTMRTIGDNERVNRWDRYEALVVLRSIRGLGTLTVKGHSRGGAIAQIVARELLRQGRLRALFIYGSKRTGNRRFVDRLVRSRRCAHLRNRGDWIPFLPPWYAWIKPALSCRPWQPVRIAHNDYGILRWEKY